MILILKVLTENRGFVNDILELLSKKKLQFYQCAYVIVKNI